MKKYLTVLFILLFIYEISFAQNEKTILQNDTLYTISGFKVYKGLILHIAEGTGHDKQFRFLAGIGYRGFSNSTITVREIYDYGVSKLGNVYAKITGGIIYHDGSKGKIAMKVNFDKAIQSFNGKPSEITVSDIFKIKPKIGSIAEEIEKLNKLYQDSIITKEEFEAGKKKILSQN